MLHGLHLSFWGGVVILPVHLTFSSRELVRQVGRCEFELSRPGSFSHSKKGCGTYQRPVVHITQQPCVQLYTLGSKPCAQSYTLGSKPCAQSYTLGSTVFPIVHIGQQTVCPNVHIG